jgi:hypothetical protein
VFPEPPPDPLLPSTPQINRKVYRGKKKDAILYHNLPPRAPNLEGKQQLNIGQVVQKRKKISEAQQNQEP